MIPSFHSSSDVPGALAQWIGMSRNSADRIPPPLLRRSVYQWHMHVYSPTNDENALKQFQGDVSSRFSNDTNVVMGRILMKAGGPHPCSQFEVGEPFDFLLAARALKRGECTCASSRSHSNVFV